MKRILVDTWMSFYGGVYIFCTRDPLQLFACPDFVQDVLGIFPVELGERVIFEFRLAPFPGAVRIHLVQPPPHFAGCLRWSTAPGTPWDHSHGMWQAVTDLLEQLGAKRVVYVKGQLK